MIRLAQMGHWAPPGTLRVLAAVASGSAPRIDNGLGAASRGTEQPMSKRPRNCTSDYEKLLIAAERKGGSSRSARLIIRRCDRSSASVG